MILSHFVNEWGFKYGRCTGICFSMCLLKLYLLKQVYYDCNITALRFLYASNAFRSMRTIDIYRQIIFLQGNHERPTVK